MNRVNEVILERENTVNGTEMSRKSEGNNDMKGNKTPWEAVYMTPIGFLLLGCSLNYSKVEGASWVTA